MLWKANDAGTGSFRPNQNGEGGFDPVRVRLLLLEMCPAQGLSSPDSWRNLQVRNGNQMNVDKIFAAYDKLASINLGNDTASWGAQHSANIELVNAVKECRKDWKGELDSPVVEEVSIVRWQEGDTILVRLAETYQEWDHTSICEQLQRHFPGCNVAVLPPGMDLQIARKEEKVQDNREQICSMVTDAEQAWLVMYEKFDSGEFETTLSPLAFNQPLRLDITQFQEDLKTGPDEGFIVQRLEGVVWNWSTCGLKDKVKTGQTIAVDTPLLKATFRLYSNTGDIKSEGVFEIKVGQKEEADTPYFAGIN